MKKIIHISGLLFSLIGASAAPASAETAGLTLGAGLRDAELRWNIAGDINGQNPDILSELTWDELHIFQTKGEIDIKFDSNICLRASAAYGWIYEGDNRDSDYAGDGRTLEFSRSNNGGGGDYMVDYSAGIGYTFSFIDTSVNKRAVIVPLVGYSYHEQNLSITDGVQTIPNTGPFPGLDSVYQTEWYGPWAGVDVLLELTGKTTFGFRYEYHDADYVAVADWNLRTDFQHPKSFEHTADGKANLWGAELRRSIGGHQEVRIGYVWERWETDAGLDRTFFSDGSVSDTRLNEVIFESKTLIISYNLHF